MYFWKGCMQNLPEAKGWKAFVVSSTVTNLLLSLYWIIGQVLPFLKIDMIRPLWQFDQIQAFAAL